MEFRLRLAGFYSFLFIVNEKQNKAKALPRTLAALISPLKLAGGRKMQGGSSPNPLQEVLLELEVEPPTPFLGRLTLGFC